MKKPPKISKDGTCANCGGPRGVKAESKTADDHPFKSTDKTIKLHAHSVLIQRMAEDDPFCTTTCAKAYYGYDISKNTSVRFKRRPLDTAALMP